MHFDALGGLPLTRETYRERMLLERTPDITDNGEFNAGPYDYVYFFCDVNSKNSKEPTEDLVMIWYQATYV